ncbi:transcription elongation factor GreA [Candidatus Daviesbacteria bacterium]|nr:transcription elongation factor GreA [Candidatus Daviesbacteria bacterium]
MKKSDKIYLTAQGLDKLKAEHDELVNIKRPEVAQRIARARDFGDLSENAEYDEAKNEQAFIEGRLEELETILRNAQVIGDRPKSDFVVIGSTVVVECEGQIDEFTIVGSVEANPAKKRISNESPVGKVLLGTKEGEEIWVTTPVVKVKYRVLEIK